MSTVTYHVPFPDFMTMVPSVPTLNAHHHPRPCRCRGHSHCRIHNSPYPRPGGFFHAGIGFLSCNRCSPRQHWASFAIVGSFILALAWFCHMRSTHPLLSWGLLFQRWAIPHPLRPHCTSSSARHCQHGARPHPSKRGGASSRGPVAKNTLALK